MGWFLCCWVGEWVSGWVGGWADGWMKGLGVKVEALKRHGHALLPRDLFGGQILYEMFFNLKLSGNEVYYTITPILLVKIIPRVIFITRKMKHISYTIAFFRFLVCTGSCKRAVGHGAPDIRYTHTRLLEPLSYMWVLRLQRFKTRFVRMR